ncbi:VOC family protein [Mycobacterium marinum]|uniref:VOC family protein n=1 Tax=Mycobacterium marinum TaxID=1781 RepID=UPI003562045C
MAISFNHTTVASHDKRKSAEFLAELLGLPSPVTFGPFLVVALEHDASLDFADVPEDVEIHPQHYAFLVSEQEFTEIYGKISSRGLPHWADPGARRPGEINHRDGGRGVYFPDPARHSMEMLTRPYGSGS